MEKKVLAVVSGKGGVGKTTLSTNIATLLALNKVKTLIIDLDIYNPSVFFHLGMPHRESGLGLFRKKEDLEDIVVIHPQTGLRIISAGVGYEKEIKKKTLQTLIDASKYDMVVLDCPPGFPGIVQNAIEVSNKIMVLISPEMPSAVSALKLADFIHKKKQKKDIHFIINRYSAKPYQLNPTEIEQILENRIDAIIPEDENVPKSIALKTPLVLYNSSSKASKAIKNLLKNCCPTYNNLAITKMIQGMEELDIISKIKKFLRL